MSSSHNIAQLENLPDPHPRTPSSRVCKNDAVSERISTPNLGHALRMSATRPVSQKPSEGSDVTILGAFHDSGTFDNTSSATLQDEFPWHEVCIDKDPQKIPPTIVPALLQPRSSSLDERSNSYVADSDSSGAEDAVPRYTALQKGKWKIREDGGVIPNIGSVRSPSPQFRFYGTHNSVEDWTVHTRPILQDYADRQTSTPLGRRLEVSIDEPPQFILGAIQLLVNRDKRNCSDRSRQLGPQLIENFVDIDCWTREYFRYHHGMQLVDGDVPALLAIVMNNFYEGVVQLIDRLVEFALENMRFCGKRSLSIGDFAFGFDFRMSQDLPFYVETSSRIREPTPIPTVEVEPASEPVTTSSGRQVKPTERAQAALEEAQPNMKAKRKKRKNTSKVIDKQTPKPSPSSPPKKSSKRPPSQHTETSVTWPTKPSAAAPPRPKATSKHTKHRPAQSSNLGLPPIMPSSLSTTGATSPQSDDGPKSGPSTSVPADSPRPSGSGSNLDANANQNLPLDPKTTPAPQSLPASNAPATSGSELTSGRMNGVGSETNSAPDTSGVMNGGLEASRSVPPRPRGPRRRRARARGQERKAPSDPRVERSSAIEASPTSSVVGARDAEASGRNNSPAGTPDTITGRPTPHPMGTENSETSAVDSPAGPRRRMVALKSTVGTSAQPGGARQGIGPRQEGSSTSVRLRAGKLVLLPPDPSHRRGDKRKLDECEE